MNVATKKSGGSVFTPYVSNFSYTASGGITQMRLGNGKWETAKFNTRMQVTELGLGNSATDASVWKTVYEYGELDSNGNVVASKNTGNIARQTLTVPGTSFVQNYKYDSLYRLTEAVEKTGATTNWSQAFNYDRYGNRIGINQAIGSLTLNTTPTVSENTNRFTSTDFGYDKNGNVINDIDPLSTLPRSFVFNGDNKQSEVKRDGVTIGRYYYDGEGKRVKKVTDQETTVFVYSSGKLIAEYSTQLSQNPSIAYTTTDHLGTPRVITDEFGQVKARRDFMPFGEELYVNVGGRTPNLEYGTSDDNIRQKFTGYQKDKETGLDFAEARMYENRHGRFTAVDPLLASGRSAMPQTFNRYVYVSNRPLSLTDPSGLDPWWWRKNKEGRYDYEESKEKPGGDGWNEVSFSNYWCLELQDYGGSGKSKYIYRGGGIDDGSRFFENERVRSFLLGFKVGAEDTGTGAGKGFGNAGISLANGVTGVGWSFLQHNFPGLKYAPNPLEIERYSYNSLTEAKFGFGVEGAAILAPGAAAAPFRAGSVLSVVPETVPFSTTQRLQFHVSRAASEVDAAGDAAFTPRQFDALGNNPNLRPAFRGNRIDVILHFLT